MSELVLTDAKVFFAYHDISGDLNAVALDYGAEPKDSTVFGLAGARRRAGGLKTVLAHHEGIWEAGSTKIDENLWFRFQETTLPMSISPTGVEGDPAYTFLSDESSYGFGTEIGEVLPFTVAAEARGPLVRGALALFGTRNATGSGIAVDLGQMVADGQRLYAALHLLDYVGAGSLVMRVQSDTATGFGSPTTQLTFPSLSTLNYGWVSAAGPIAEQFFRADWTFSGTSFRAALVVGIL